MDNVIWYVRQLLPLKYRTVYEEDGITYACEWRMWFGRCFDIKREVVGRDREYDVEYADYI